MTSKSFNVAKVPSITPTMEKSVSKAFQEFGKQRETPALYNGRLRTFRGHSSCNHSWKPLTSIPKEHAEYLKSITEEDPVEGETKFCSHCGSVSYWEEGKIWLYDATTRFFGKPPKRRHHREK
jgi:hypothetical protein